MPWKNLSAKALQLPSGKTVKPGDTFTEKQAAGLNVRALERGGTVRYQKTAPKEKGKKK